MTAVLVVGLVLAVAAGGVGWGIVIGASTTYDQLRPERHAAEMNAAVSRISAELLAVHDAAAVRFAPPAPVVTPNPAPSPRPVRPSPVGRSRLPPAVLEALPEDVHPLVERAF